MRLINTQTLELVDSSEIPAPHQYAILSHRWDPGQEITLQEVRHLGEEVKLKSGFKKIQGFCREALSWECSYGWVDTCCIDKSDPTELAEAINSMFKWYNESAICIVYLNDVFSTESPGQHNTQFNESRWFGRGWTLQELIAPRQLYFYTADWHPLGTKHSCLKAVEAITKIAEPALMGESLGHFSIAQKMSWAAARKTTKDEDMAYCLLGIFDVSMPLLYGEGLGRAFVRLQQTIMEASDDQSILAWESYDHAELQKWPSALAPAPRYFKYASDVERLIITSKANHFSYQRKPFSMTNMGVRITLPIIRSLNSEFWAVLDCHKAGTPVCIPLSCTTEDGLRYQKARGSLGTVDEFAEIYNLCEVRDVYVHGSTSPPRRFAGRSTSSTPFRRGRWSTDNRERAQIIKHLDGSKRGQEDGVTLYHALQGDVIIFLICTCLAGFVFFFVVGENMKPWLPTLGIPAVVGSLTLKRSLALHLRLFVAGGLSFAGVRLETISNESSDFMGQKRLEYVSDRVWTSWPPASSVKRYDVHDHDKLLRTYWLQDMMLVVPFVVLVPPSLWLLIRQTGESWGWILKVVIACLSCLGCLGSGIWVLESLKHRHRLKAGVYLLYTLVGIGTNIVLFHIVLSWRPG